MSILDIDDGVIEVLATAGNNRLGGDDFDKCIMDWMAAEFKKTEGCLLYTSLRVWIRSILPQNPPGVNRKSVRIYFRTLK